MILSNCIRLSELSMGLVYPQIGLGWVLRSCWVDIFQFSMGWVDYAKGTYFV